MLQNSVKPLHIAIDARMYGTAQRGIGRYLIKLIEGLEEITPSPQPSPTEGEGDSSYTIFLRKENFEEYQPNNPRFKKVLWDVPWYGWREQMSNVTCQMSDVDVVHFPHWNIPLFFNRPFVVTIHDLELFSSNRTRENSTRGRLVYWFKFRMFKLIFRHAVLASRAIIVPSQFVKNQLLEHYPQVTKKVNVIYEAPTVPPSQMSSVNSQVSGQYVLYVGAAYPHKNLPRLLEAWQSVHKKLPEYKLVLVGREDFFWKKLKDAWFSTSSNNILRAEWSAVEKSILFYGEATDDELADLYKNAALLVQPSLEEGFSLPPLEALSFGCPAAVSDIPVHREICGDAVHYFNPLSSGSIAETLKKTLDNPAHAPLPREYSWLNHAKETKALYEAIKKV